MTSTNAALGALAMAAVLLLAGCAGPIASGTTTPAPAADPGEEPAGTDVSGDAGVVEFYISDERNAIDDFEHLNVTITRVGLHRVGDADGGESTATATATSNATATTTATASNATATGTASPTATATPSPTLTPGTETDEEKDDDEKEGDDGEGNAKWVEYTVNRTVDLTELKGANATKLDVLEAPNGEYDKVFVYVDGIDATLKNGESVNVKLPSSKLQINKGFTVGDGTNVSFVFDLSIHKAGKSGKYILRPVISQSGTGEEVDIEDVDEKEKEGETDETDDDETESNETEEREAASDLAAEFQGPVKAGKEAKLKVTGADGPVAGANVTVNGEAVGTTDGSGTVTFSVPADAEELEVVVRKGEAEVELTREVDGGAKGSLRAIR